MQKTKILLDFDDVLNDLSPYWRNLHFERTGELLGFNSWDVSKESMYGDAIYTYFGESSFFYDAPLKDGASLLIKFLENSLKFDYVIVSACNTPEHFELHKKQKIEWLNQIFGSHVSQKFHLTTQPKNKFVCDIIIDDNFQNILDCKKFKLKIMMRCNHNKYITKSVAKSEYDLHDDFIIVNNNYELIDFLEKIS